VNRYQFKRTQNSTGIISNPNETHLPEQMLAGVNEFASAEVEILRVK
jgi:hypothetical protein